MAMWKSSASLSAGAPASTPSKSASKNGLWSKTRELSEAAWTVSSDTYFCDGLWVAKAVCEHPKWVDLGCSADIFAANGVSGELFLVQMGPKMSDRGSVVNTYLNKLSSDIEADADTPA